MCVSSHSAWRWARCTLPQDESAIVRRRQWQHRAPRSGDEAIDQAPRTPSRPSRNRPQPQPSAAGTARVSLENVLLAAFIATLAVVIVGWTWHPPNG